MMKIDATDQDRCQGLLRRRMPGISDEGLAAWLAVEPRSWVMAHGEALHAAGLSARDATDLYRRLGPQTATMLSALLNAGRFADIDIRFIHLWAASGLLRAPAAGAGRRAEARSAARFTAWVSQAREYIVACEGDQRLAALSAAAGLGVQEVLTMRQQGELVPETLEVMAAFREQPDDA